MKNFILIALVAFSAFCVEGCSQSANQETASSELSTGQTKQSSPDKELTIGGFLSEFEGQKFLASNGKPVEVEKKSGLDAALLGAKDSVILNFYSGKVEVLEFDTSITSGRDSMEKLKKDGVMGTSYTFNKNLAIAKFNNVKEWDKVKTLFEGL